MEKYEEKYINNLISFDFLEYKKKNLKILFLLGLIFTLVKKKQRRKREMHIFLLNHKLFNLFVFYLFV